MVNNTQPVNKLMWALKRQLYSLHHRLIRIWGRVGVKNKQIQNDLLTKWISLLQKQFDTMT